MSMGHTDKSCDPTSVSTRIVSSYEFKTTSFVSVVGSSTSRNFFLICFPNSLLTGSVFRPKPKQSPTAMRHRTNLYAAMSSFDRLWVGPPRCKILS